MAKYTYQDHDRTELEEIFGKPSGYVTYADAVIASKNIYSLYRYMALSDIFMAIVIAVTIYNKKNYPLP